MRKASLATLVLGAVLTADQVVNANKSLDRWNWSNNIQFTAKKLIEPSSVEELQSTVKDARG